MTQCEQDGEIGGQPRRQWWCEEKRYKSNCCIIYGVHYRVTVFEFAAFKSTLRGMHREYATLFIRQNVVAPERARCLTLAVCVRITENSFLFTSFLFNFLVLGGGGGGAYRVAKNGAQTPAIFRSFFRLFPL